MLVILLHISNEKLYISAYYTYQHYNNKQNNEIGITTTLSLFLKTRGTSYVLNGLKFWKKISEGKG